MILFQDSPGSSSPTSPTLESRSRRSRRLVPRRCRYGAVSFALIVTACLAGICLALVISVFDSPAHQSRFSPFPFRAPILPEPQLDNIRPLVPPSPPARNHDDDHLDLEELRDLVAQTKGFFVRDYSLGLGWNNVRCRS
jgi:hypothetical protein